MKPNVSIIIPSYNDAAIIIRSVSSALIQECDVYEIIVIDDGSIDKTRDVVETFGDKVKYKYQKNKGPAAARNTGIALSTGEYIAFLDADDEWLPTKMNRQIRCMVDNPDIGLCFTDMMHFVDGQKIHHSYLHENNYQYVNSGWIYNNLLRECFIFTPTVLIRREVLDQVGYFDETLKVAEDYDLWLRVCDQYPAVYIDSPLVIRHRHDHNITSDISLYLKSSIRQMQKLRLRNADNPERKSIISRKLAILHFELSYRCFLDKYRKHACTELCKSLRHSFSYALSRILMSMPIPCFAKIYAKKHLDR